MSEDEQLAAAITNWLTWDKPYAVVKLGATAGLMITASHNPKDDNGYKVYWSNGAQILTPRDADICKVVLEHLQPVEGAWDEENVYEHELVQDPRNLAGCQEKDIFDWYYKDALKWCCDKQLNSQSAIRIAYTPFHGVGLEFALCTLNKFGFELDKHVVVVEEQKDPDPDFSTVPFPNPEEGRQVLKLAIETADANDCSLVFANDPDADRLQLAEKYDGAWRILTGNEMGSLLAWRLWTNWRAANPNVPADKVYFLNSTVSTKFVSTMAQSEGFNYEETLTGFKWMGNRTDELRKQGFIVPLAWEESIGFMVGESLDKDGVLAAAIFADFCAQLYAQGSSLTKQLYKIYHTYGYHVTRSSYFGVYSSEQAKRVCDRIRYGECEPEKVGIEHLKYPTTIGNLPIMRTVDLTLGVDSAALDKKPTLPVSAKTQMITFHLEGGSWCTIRASGTEPKLKYYVELRTDKGLEEGELDRVNSELDEFERAIVNELIKPKENGLKLRSG